VRPYGWWLLLLFVTAWPGKADVLKPDDYRHYIETFNADDEEMYPQYVPNARAWEFLAANIPLLDCPDEALQTTYYFRWWTYRKHLKETPAGFVVTEFLPPVGWAGKFNTIDCAAGHHLYEGRWLADARFLDDYSRFWFRGGGEPRRYSFWAADAILARAEVTGDTALPLDLLPDLVRNYQAWEDGHRDANGLYWQIDDRDGMEVSLGGSGYRATINSYQYGDAQAIARLAELKGDAKLAADFRARAVSIKQQVQTQLWDDGAKFFKVRRRDGDGRNGGALAAVRELHGLTPWYFDLPDPGHEVAWKQITDPDGFAAPYGLRTAERRSPGYQVAYGGHECQWNGPSWPYSTAITLTALARLLHDYRGQATMTKADYFALLRNYADSQRRRREDGRVVPWIDENQNPDTGDWISRTLLIQRHATPKERGKDYNHSTFCDLVISGLIGLQPRLDDTVVVEPLVPDGTWDWFCLDRVPYHGRRLTILWDRDGRHYGRGAGLRVLADGVEIAAAERLGVMMGKLPAKGN
jgi:hypothetical protein